MPKPFLILDESMTMHGIRFRMDGGRWERFNKNPIMLFMHVRGEVIGKWENVRFEGGAWIADPVFDKADKFAEGIAGKVERGFLNACSPGVGIHAAELIDNEVVATDWEPFETSIVDAGSNLNALHLYTTSGEMIADTESFIKTLTLSIMDKKEKTGEELVKEIVEKEVFPKGVVLALGAPEGASNEVVTKAITDLIAKNVSLELALKANETTKAQTLVDTAFAAKKITDSDRTHYLKLAAADFETTKAILDGIEAPKNLSQFAAAGAAATETTVKADKEEYNELFKSGTLFTLKLENPDKFKRLFKAEHGFDPEA